MVSLLGLEGYSANQIQQARDFSPALNRYLAMEIPIGDLHQQRHEAWAKCVLATYFQTATAEQVCAYWSQTADEVLTRAWIECGLDKTEAVLFALGKQGARELNLSSDIDLLIVAEGADMMPVERGLRRLQQLLHQSGEFGFCYRLDFDLRPGGKMGPLITTPSQFQDYYWSQGETWERLALVRLRAIVGSKTLEQQITDLARRFSFRKFLDFTLLDDLKALRSKVHQKGFARVANELHLKLEVGGIRDIELFVHSLLILNGGKIVELQTRSTSAAITLLKAKNLLPAHEADLLFDSYWYYRQAENLVQSFEDRQTHSLTLNLPKVSALPSMADVQARMFAVDKIVSSLLGKVDLETVQLPPDEAAQLAWLKGLGFSEAAIASSWDSLIKATALSHKNDRDERARQEFLYSFVTELARNKALDRDLGLNLLVDFVKATRAKATFFTMLLRTPRLIEDLARLFCLSPYLGSIIASRPELLDNFILQLDEAWAADTETLLQQMTERKLLTELWSANQFLTDHDLNSMFTRITQTADSICAQLMIQLQNEFPESKIDIVALGKWAGGEMGLRSDLDFIFITPGAPTEGDFKVARRFISRL
ncbi:MAG: [protein-PII] uridylyltransferase family protein, partial [Bdellovibrionales bacterium]